jgi:hypothetical protein
LIAAARAAAAMAVTVVAAALVLTVIWAGFGHARFAELAGALNTGVIGGVALVLLTVAFVPNLAIYASTYLAGTGFAVGAGTQFSPFEVHSAPMPVFPLLGILPTQAPSMAGWLVVVPVAAGGLAGVMLCRRVPASTPWWTMAGLALAASLTAAGGLAAAVAAASGGAGPGRMAQVGADPRTALAAFGLEFALGCVPVALLARTQVANRLYDVTHPDRPIRVKGRGPQKLPSIAEDPVDDGLGVSLVGDQARI